MNLPEYNQIKHQQLANALFSITKIETAVDQKKYVSKHYPKRSNAAQSLPTPHLASLDEPLNHAGLCVAQIACTHFWRGCTAEKRIAIMVGRGYTGNIALRAAYILSKKGIDLIVLTTAENAYQRPINRRWITRLRTAGVRVNVGERAHVAMLEKMGELDVDLIIDGLLGSHSQDKPAGLTAHLINWANDDFAPVLSICAPSGLYAHDQQSHHQAPIIEATETVLFVPPFPLLLTDEAADFVGDLYIGDITVPSEQNTDLLSQQFIACLTTDSTAMPVQE